MHPPQYTPRATIAYTTNPSTIPYWAAWLLPGIVFLCTVAMAEYYAQPTKPRNAVLAMALAWHTVVDSVAGLIVVNFLTEIGKDVVGFLRPDYLARCQPPGNNSTMSDIVLAWGSAVVSATCTQTGSSVVDGRRSFPSGTGAVGKGAPYAAKGHATREGKQQQQQHMSAFYPQGIQVVWRIGQVMLRCIGVHKPVRCMPLPATTASGRRVP